MRLAFTASGNEVEMFHDDEILTWNVATLNRKSSNRLPDTGIEDRNIFDEVNQYWAQIPKQNQDGVFYLYQKIQTAFAENWSLDTLTQAIQPLIKDLMTFHNLDEIKHWMRYHSHILYPAGLEDTFPEATVGMGHTRNRTYIKSDYQDLVALAIALRGLMPVWGVFISRTKDESGNTFKEFKAARLLARSEIYHSPPMEKLRLYLSEALSSQKTKDNAIYGGVSTSDLLEWGLGLTLVRRLSIAALSGNGKHPSIVAYIHNYIEHRIGREGGFPGGVIRAKITDRGNQDSEQKLSTLENYKIKEENPAGDIVGISVYMRRQEEILRRLAPNIDRQLLVVSNQSIKALENQQLREPQLLLMQIVLSPLIPHQGILEQIRTDVLTAMATTQAILWHRGYKELAGLMTAIAVVDGDEFQMTAVESRARIPKEKLEILNQLYPFSRRMTSKQQSAKQTNVAATNIDMIADMFAEHPWRLTVPAAWVMQITGDRNDRSFIVPHNIKILLADLTIDIVSKK